MSNVGHIRTMGSIPGLERYPGEGNGTHSSILAWETAWTEEPGRLQSKGSQRVRHDWVRIHEHSPQKEQDTAV